MVEAETGLRRWLKQKPSDGNAWLMLGDLLFDQGRWDEALSALLRVRAVDEDWPHAQTLIGEIWIKRRNLSEAERFLRQAAGRDRRAIEPRRRLVYILVLERRPAEAY